MQEKLLLRDPQKLTSNSTSMLKLALSHDVDRIRKHYQYFTYTTKYLAKGNFKNALYHFSSLFGPEPYWNFPKIMELEDSLGVRSTFFILDETLPFKLFDPKNWQLSLGRYKISNQKLRTAVKTLDKNGWEIGIHGSYYSYNNEELLKNEKEHIEEIVGHEIIGSRQHYLNMDSGTWSIQKKIGLKYDSTWGLPEDIGFKEGRILPFRPFNDDFIEIPMTVMDVAFMPLTNRWEKLYPVIDTLERNNGILVLNWHHRVFNEKEFPGYQTSYLRIIKECKERGAFIGTLADMYHIIQKESKNEHNY